MKILFTAAVAAVTALSYGTASAKTDPLFAGAVSGHHTAHGALPAGASSFTFSVNFEGGTYAFPAALTLKKGVLGGSVTAPSGCVATVDEGSTDKHNSLNLAVTFGGACAGEPGTFIGKLKFKAGTGSGTFTDPYGAGPYVASKP